MPLSVGDRAPEFTLPNQNGEPVALADFRGKTVILYFYPKDDTPGCTTEACGFRDLYEQFTAQNVVILGISGDSTKSHQKFSTKFNLPFPLLSDTDFAIATAYDSYGKKKFMGKEYMGDYAPHFCYRPRGQDCQNLPQC
jgi:Peroxiredoxin